MTDPVIPQNGARPQAKIPAEPHAGHRPEDTNVRGVVIFVIALGIMMLVLHVAVGVLFFRLLAARQASQRPAPLATLRTPPPGPRLQTDPKADLVQMREAERQILENYGWLDRPSDRIRIPVELAMQIVAERAQSAPAATGSATQPGTP